MRRTLALLCIAAVLGVVTATSSTCGIGLIAGTTTWCWMPGLWLFAFPVATVFAVVLGFPAALLYRRLGLVRWWQFAVGGAVIAVPFWFEAALPFASPRWQQSGFYDSLNYLGSGLFGGLWFWFLLRWRSKMPFNPTVERDAPQAARPSP